MRLCSALLVLFTSNRTPHGGSPPKARGMDVVLEQKLQQRLQLQDELPDVQHAVARARVGPCLVQCTAVMHKSASRPCRCTAKCMPWRELRAAILHLVCEQPTNCCIPCSTAKFCTMQADLSKCHQTMRDKQFALDALQVSGNMQPMSGAAARAAVKDVSQHALPVAILAGQSLSSTQWGTSICAGSCDRQRDRGASAVLTLPKFVQAEDSLHAAQIKLDDLTERLHTLRSQQEQVNADVASLRGEGNAAAQQVGRGSARFLLDPILSPLLSPTAYPLSMQPEGCVLQQLPEIP